MRVNSAGCRVGVDGASVFWMSSGSAAAAYRISLASAENQYHLGAPEIVKSQADPGSLSAVSLPTAN